MQEENDTNSRLSKAGVIYMEGAVKDSELMGKETDKKYEIMKQIMDTLEEILCSYQGRGHQSAYIDVDALALLASLFVYGQMKAEKYQYEYDEDIYKDEEAVEIYRELAMQTRWRVGNRTQIEPIRMNALK